MRSKIVLAAILLLPLTSLFSQKIDREKIGYFNYVQPAANTDLTQAQYYVIKVDVEDNNAYRSQIAQERFNGGRFKMVNAGEEFDFTIEIREGAYSFSSPEKKSYNKDKEVLYYYEGSVSYHFTIEITNSAGKELFRDDVRGSSKFQGDASGSLSVANDYYVKKKTQVKEDVLLQELDDLSELFLNHFSDVDKTIFLNHIVIKEKKYEYPDFNARSEDLNRIYDILNANFSGTSESEELLKNAIQFFTGFLQDATPNDEKSQKNADVTAAGYYNLGIALFMAGRYQEAKKAFEDAASYDPKVFYDVKNMIKVCGDLAMRKSAHINR